MKNPIMDTDSVVATYIVRGGTPNQAVNMAKTAFANERKGQDYNDLTARHFGEVEEGHRVGVWYEVFH